jgi:hypothetical protein
MAFGRSRTAALAVAFLCLASCPNAQGGGGDAGDGGDADATLAGEGGDASLGLDAFVMCDPVRTISPIVVPVDALTGAAICNVTLVDAPNDALLPCTGNDGCTGPCEFTVAELTGSETMTFSVTITAPGYGPTVVDGLMPTECGCDAGACKPPQLLMVSLATIDGGAVDAGMDAPMEGSPDAHGDARPHDATSDHSEDVVRLDAVSDVTGSSDAHHD